MWRLINKNTTVFIAVNGHRMVNYLTTDSQELPGHHNEYQSQNSPEA